MSVTPEELLSFARELHQSASTEVHHRNTISRAYYAAYHVANAFHAALPSVGTAALDATGIHSELFYRLDHPTIAANDPRYKKSRLIGLKLRNFHAIRIKADYRLDHDVNGDDAADSLIKAASIFQLTK